MTTIRTRTTAATIGPFAARATTAAIARAIGEPISGTKAAKNSSSASGRASGTPSANRASPTNTALVPATRMMPWVYPVNVRQAARPAITTRVRAFGGSWSQNQFHCRSPEWMKKTEQNNARTNTVTTSTSRPAPLTAVLMRAERWLDRY